MDVKLSGLEVSKSSAQSKNVTTKKEKTFKTDSQINVQPDSYENARPKKKVTYDKPGIKPDMKTIHQLMKDSDKAFAQLKLIVSEMLKRQGLKFQDIDIKFDEINAGDLKDIKIDEIAQKEAQAMIAESGEYSAESVSDRIVDFAKAISGGDKSKLDLLKTAIDKGFEAAEADFGDKLPEITKETYKLTMDKLDAWANEDETPASEPNTEG